MQYVVYKITCNSPDVDHVYVGSTKKVKHRKYEHKYDSKRETNTSKLYTAIRDHGGFEKWTMEIIESFTCDTFLEARMRERYFCEDLNADLNSVRPQASQEERRFYKKESNKQTQSHKVHCETCNCEFRKHDKAKHYRTKKHRNNLEMKNSESKNESLN